MVIDVDFPMYVLTDEDSGAALVVAEEVKGFLLPRKRSRRRSYS